MALKAEPNAAHYALAKFSLSSIRENIAPGSKFTLITQNVDGLSVRALDSVKRADASASQADEMIEMHGRLFDVKCSSAICGHVELDFSSPICHALAGTEVSVEQNSIETTIPENELPRCKKCGSLARPGVVWFGESIPALPRIEKIVEEADFCIVVGTSSTVYPAAGFAAYVRDNGGKVAVFNIERTGNDDDADFLFLGPCENSLPEALGTE